MPPMSEMRFVGAHLAACVTVADAMVVMTDCVQDLENVGRRGTVNLEKALDAEKRHFMEDTNSLGRPDQDGSH